MLAKPDKFTIFLPKLKFPLVSSYTSSEPEVIRMSGGVPPEGWGSCGHLNTLGGI